MATAFEHSYQHTGSSAAQWRATIPANAPGMGTRPVPAHRLACLATILAYSLAPDRKYSVEWRRSDHRIESSDLCRSVLGLLSGQTSGQISRLGCCVQVANRGSFTELVWRLAFAVGRNGSGADSTFLAVGKRRRRGHDLSGRRTRQPGWFDQEI